MSVDANDVLFGSGIPAATFKSPGDTFAGPITKLEAVQQRKFKDGKPTDELDTWPNGDPKMMAVATLRTHHRDPQDPSDDGQRKVYIASRDLQGKVRDAVKAVGGRKLDIGAMLQVTYTHDEKTESGLYAKVYQVAYQPPAAAGANAALGMQDQAPAQQYVQQQPQQQYVNTAALNPPVQQAQIPPVQQMMQQPQAQQAPVEVPAAAGAVAGVNMDSLPPEAQAMVQRMLAQQQAGV
jgi:hypothetical protein